MKTSYDILCLDERDSPNVAELKGKSRAEIQQITNVRHFGICGVIIPGADYPEINMQGRRIQSKIFGVGKFVPFHYAEILNNKGDFSLLAGNPDKKRSLITLLNNFVLKNKYKIIASFVNKQKLALEYGVFEEGKLVGSRKISPNIASKSSVKKLNLYQIALKHILIEYHKLLTNRRKRGIIVAEARGQKEDQELLDSFYRYQNVGVGRLSGKELRSAISDLLIIRKSQNHLGCQLADLIAYPLYDNFVEGHSKRSDHFIESTSYEDKIQKISEFPN